MTTAKGGPSPAARYDDWPPDAVAAVERAIAVHGGQTRWGGVRAIHLGFGTAAGLLVALKGYRRALPAPRPVEGPPPRRTTTFHGYPDAHEPGRLVHGGV